AESTVRGSAPRGREVEAPRRPREVEVRRMSTEMRLIIISGLSGSGKSVALHVLEDLGYYCIDNMPAALLKSLLEEISRIEKGPEVRVAVGVDARNRRQDLEALPALL